MPPSSEKQLDQRHRLLAMREYLRVAADPDDSTFSAEVTKACIEKVEPIIEANRAESGEVIVAAIARELRIRFEEVKAPSDIAALERKYLVEQRELGFGMLAKELADPGVDALLFQRMNASPEARDDWIAVINMQQTESRGYWSRPHEIVHRLAEPPQQRLPFFRHRADHENRLERIIDLVAAELAFPRRAFGPHVMALGEGPLTWDVVEQVRGQFAPTASLQSVAKALLQHWRRPAVFLTAAVRGRRRNPCDDIALRIAIEGFSAGNGASPRFFPNMRVPRSSPMYAAFERGGVVSDNELLKRWTTSTGSSLPDQVVFMSAVRLRSVVYGLVSFA